MKSGSACAVALLLSLFAGGSCAQVALFATTQLIPVVASTASFVSEISIVNASKAALTLDMTFYEAETSSSPGPKACTQVNVPLDGSLTVRLAGVGGQCTLGAGNHHGFVILRDATAAKEGLFAAYSRVSNPQGIGFSVEGFPIGHIGGGGEAESYVPALKRVAATAQTPAYQSNCFVATFDDAVDYTIHVYVGGGDYTISGTLQPYQMRRYLDIFAVTGVPAGDWYDVVVKFEKTTAAQLNASLLAFCTVQDNTSFGADFRIARNYYAGDWSRLPLVCMGINFDGNDCTTLKANPYTLASAGNKTRWLTMFYAPDTVNCQLVSPQLGNLEMRLVRVLPFALLAGGDNQTTFSYATGPRSAINLGLHTFYLIEVGPREGTTPTYPIPYGIRCFAGNGMLAPFQYQTAAPDDF